MEARHWGISPHGSNQRAFKKPNQIRSKSNHETLLIKNPSTAFYFLGWGSQSLPRSSRLCDLTDLTSQHLLLAPHDPAALAASVPAAGHVRSHLRAPACETPPPLTQLPLHPTPPALACPNSLYSSRTQFPQGNLPWPPNLDEIPPQVKEPHTAQYSSSIDLFTVTVT